MNTIHLQPASSAICKDAVRLFIRVPAGRLFTFPDKSSLCKKGIVRLFSHDVCDALLDLGSLELIVATHNNFPVHMPEKLSGVAVLPLVRQQSQVGMIKGTDAAEKSVTLAAGN